MRTLLVVSLFSVALCNLLACRLERWAAKVLTDNDRNLIDRTSQVLSVGHLAALDSPSDRDRRSSEASDHRIADPKKTTYKVTAILLGYRKETDGDFHLVLQDADSDVTIIAEIPDPACVDDLDLANQLVLDKRWFLSLANRVRRRFGLMTRRPSSSAESVSSNIKHSTEQDGVAPNNFELHPVLVMSLGS